MSIFNSGKDKLYNDGILMLQETHSLNKYSKTWKKYWKGDIFQNHGTSNSRGVLIAFTENFDNKIIRYDHDNR